MMIQVASSQRLDERGRGAVDLRPAAVADGERQDQDADQRREEEDDPQLEERQGIHPRCVGRGLLGEQREVPHDGALASGVGPGTSGLDRPAIATRRARTSLPGCPRHSRRNITSRNVPSESAVSGPEHADQPDDRKRVLAGRGVVVVAEQQQPADAAIRSARRPPA